ncbi:hypothetical protein K502DRAFT_357130 [Neoconidiobolus thromboides FSU 785]|nr:hypothetical protein K502DRAFT_357130 [Neoconidiobolus thromboides FSU 785]
MKLSIIPSIFLKEESYCQLQHINGQLILNSLNNDWKLIDLKIQFVGYEETKGLNKRKVIIKNNLDLFEEFNELLTIDEDGDYIGKIEKYKLNFNFFLSKNLIPSFNDLNFDKYLKINYYLKCKLEVKYNNKLVKFKCQLPIIIYMKSNILSTIKEHYTTFDNNQKNKNVIYLTTKLQTNYLSGQMMTINFELRNLRNQNINSIDILLIKQLSIQNKLIHQSIISEKTYKNIRVINKNNQQDISYYILLFNLPSNESSVLTDQYKIEYKINILIKLKNNIKLKQQLTIDLLHYNNLLNNITQDQLKQEKVLLDSLLNNNNCYSIYERDIDTPTTNLEFINYYYQSYHFLLNQFNNNNNNSQNNNNNSQNNNSDINLNKQLEDDSITVINIMPSEELPISQILRKSKSIEIKDQKLRFNTYPSPNPSTSKHIQTKSINHLPWRNNSSNCTIKSNHRKTKSLDNYVIDCDKLLSELPSPPIRPKYQLIQQKLATISIEDMKSDLISTNLPTLPTIHSKSSCHLRSQSYDIYESNDKKRRDITLDAFENDYYFNNDYGKLPKINNNYQQHNKSLSIDSHPKLLLNQFIDNMIVPPPPMMEEEGEEEFVVPGRKDTFNSDMTLVEEEEDEILDESMEVLKDSQRWEINERFVVKPCKRLK